MDSASGEKKNEQDAWCAKNDPPRHAASSHKASRDISHSSASIPDAVPVGFMPSYHVLTEVATNMRCGFILLGKQEHLTYSNPSAQRLLNLHTQMLVDGQLFDVRQHLLTLAADPLSAQQELDRLWAQPTREASTELALADAAVRWLRVHSFPVRDEHGVALGRGLLFDDITLEHSAREVRTETLSLAAHELKTPLAIIKGCATTLLGGSARWEPAMQREMLQMIDTQSDRLYDILNTLLDVWRLDAGTQMLRFSQVYLPEILEQLLERWRKQAPRHFFVLQVTPELPALVCDIMRVEQAINHLLSNAVTYSPFGKHITLRVEATDVEMRASISDEGVGIASEHLDRIFDRFYRVSQGAENQAGSGLGLAAARATIEAHGGRIWADSLGPGQGAIFYFTLPLVPSIPAEMQKFMASVGTNDLTAAPQVGRRDGVRSTSLKSLKQDQRMRVLLAESDVRLTRYLRANLEEQRYRVQAVSHGVQFLRQLDLEEPDIILLSTQLSDMSGVELLQRLRDFSPIPVLMLCEECDEDTRVQLLDLGCDDLVMKPFGMKELLARVRALLRRQPATIEQSVTQSLFTTGNLTIDYAQHSVTMQGRPVQLSRTEYKLLSVLAQNVGMVVTHELLLEKVWGPEYHRDIDFIWVYISRLRRKIDADTRHPTYVLTVPNVGYKLAKL